MNILKQFRLFGEYNHLMNGRLYNAASQLSQDDLCRNRGAFFKSVLGTLNHILVGDIIWLKRFSAHPSSKQTLSCVSDLDMPVSLDAIIFHDLEHLRNERIKIDDVIIQWIGSLSESDMDDPITYKNMAGIRFTKPFAALISHLFFHQTHHRGQVTTLLSQSGVDFGDTDLIEVIGEIKS